jgi:hypothetical protein
MFAFRLISKRLCKEVVLINMYCYHHDLFTSLLNIQESSYVVAVDCFQHFYFLEVYITELYDGIMLVP